MGADKAQSRSTNCGLGRRAFAALGTFCLIAVFAVALVLAGCAGTSPKTDAPEPEVSQMEAEVQDVPADPVAEAQAAEEQAAADHEAAVQAAYDKLDISTDFRDSFVHGEKGAEFQKYIVLHDTEGDGSASSVIDWWDSNGNLVAAHFVINKDGSIVQCAPLDAVVHHAGFGDTGHNQRYGVEDESRDDKRGTQPIGSWAADYGMNSYSIGIELVHVGGSSDYPKAQLEALDNLIAYLDAYYGFESEIIDHKAWRTGNSDTSPEFSGYLENYQSKRTHQ